MKKEFLSRFFISAAVLAASVATATGVHADEFTDGTVTMPRSGKEFVSLPSPEAAELCRHIEHAINYSTGRVSLTFPLWTYDCGGISLPVSISYQTGGIKADSEAGALGVGWELNCGGCVSRSVVGMPDDDPNVEFDVTKSSDLSFLREVHANNADAMYDRYSFSAGGYTGSFIIRADGKVVQLTPVPDVVISRTAAGFDITTPDGTLYRYCIPETLHYKYEPGSYSNTTVIPDYTCVCQWRLSRIVSPSRTDSVTLSYEGIPDLTKVSSQGAISVSWESEKKTPKWSRPTGEHPHATAHHIYRDRHRLAAVTGRGGTLRFAYAGASERCTGITVSNCLGETVRRVTFGSGRTLASYRITDSASNLLDGADFTYHAAVGSDSGKDFFGYRNGGGSKLSAGYDPDSLGAFDPHDSALDRLLRPSWKRQPVLAYTLSESLLTVTTMTGTRTELEYEPNDAGRFLTYGRIAPGLRLRRETVTDLNTGNIRTRTLTYSPGVASVDFSALQPGDFVSVSGNYSGTNADPYATYTTGATLSVSCRLQGSPVENTCVYYGKVTETVEGTGLASPLVTDYEYDTSQAVSGLVPHYSGWSPSDLRVAGTRRMSDGIVRAPSDVIPDYVYDRTLTVIPVRGYYRETIGERAPLRRVTRWRTESSGARRVWRRTEYHNGRSEATHDMGLYSETVIRVRGGAGQLPPNVGSVDAFDFRDAADFNRFRIYATSERVYVDSITETEYDEHGDSCTVVRRMGYNNRPLKWLTGTRYVGQITGPDGNKEPLFELTYLPDPEIPDYCGAQNGLLRTEIVRCGDEWVRTDHVYSSTSNTPLMRELSRAGIMSLPVETYHTTGHGYEYDGTAVSERLTYARHTVSGQLCLSSDVVRARTGGPWHTLDSVSAGAHDIYGNPLEVTRNGGTPSYYAWTHSGTALASVTTAGMRTAYTWIPLVGCTRADSPSGLVTVYSYSGARLSGVSVGGSKVKEYTYSVRGTSPASDARNYVNERTIADAGKSRAVNTRTYYDGFGHTTGTVTADNTMGSAVATLDEYDAAGRLTRSYTPRPAARPWDVPSAPNPGGDAMPYSVITYSGSADTRPLSSTIPGQEYSGHSTTVRRLFGKAHAGGSEGALTCRRYRPGVEEGSVTLAGHYPAGALTVEVTTDGDGRTALTFTDFRGRLILTRTLSDTGATPEGAVPGHWTDTYNVYDDAGNLVFVVTPVAAPQMSATGKTWSASAGATDPGAQCYAYTYDGAMRLRAKKAPGAAAVSYTYDATGALTLTQDGAQRSRGVCSFALADSLGRPALTGECVRTDALVSQVESAHAVATRSAAAGNIQGYMPGITLARHQVLTATYYDDYSHLSLDCFARLSRRLQGITLPQHKGMAAGLPTGTWTAVLGAATLSSSDATLPGTIGGVRQLPDSVLIAQNGYLESTTACLYYDGRDRVTATVTSDHLGGVATATTEYDNAGMPLSVTYVRRPLSASGATESNRLAYAYDGLGRVSGLKFTRGDSVYALRTHTYDGAGRLARSGYGNGCGISYTYRASGALESMTAAGPSGTATYTQTLRYATGGTPSYSGNVGSMDWRGADGVTRRYGYRYDGHGRLISASYSEPGARPATAPVTGTPSYTASYTYGADSRPLTVRRQGVSSVAFTGSSAVPSFGEVDNLTFTYTGALLTKVHDAAADIVYAGATDFDDGADKAVEYTYDADGRLVSDANKGITSIRYNAIGLPAEITFGDGSSITNRYGADGTLLQRVGSEPLKVMSPVSLAAITVPHSETVDDHIGALTYRKGALWRVDTPAGYIASGRMHYYIRDHQGNVRQVTDSDGNVEQDNHYYPYGMLMGESSDILATARSGRNPLLPSTANPYLYGGKEYLTTAGANLLDFTARTYDPTILLFHTPDPLRDKYLPVHSYLYCGANPIMFTDPSGMVIVASTKEFQEKVLAVMGEAFGNKVKDFSFNDNNELTFNGDTKGLSGRQKKLLEGVQYIMDSEDITEVVFGESVVVKDVNGNDVTLNAEEGGGAGTILKSENKNLDRNYIIINPEVKETTVDALDSKYFNENIPHQGGMVPHAQKVELTPGDMFFHEIGHLLFDRELQGQVIDYNNYYRKTVGLPARPYDIVHNPKAY